MNDTHDNIPASTGESKPGPFLAKVISHLDSSYMGGLEVEILRNVGNDGSSGQTHQVKYMSPFYGVTSVDHTSTKPNNYNNTQKSYGMWMVPPDPGTTVIVVFIDGDSKRGYWMGCVQDDGINFMVPGIAATESVVDGESRLPVAEYNKAVNKGNTSADNTKIKKPVHPFAKVLITEGLDKDDIRGITTSSARRETPSMVFGISTPGPLDKSSGAKQGTIGKKDHPIKNAYVSRLGGSTFVMDDGDDKFVREKPANKAGPTYVGVEAGGTPGDSDHSIPHNELVRIRTRSGHQILLHNSEDLIYISHGSGNSWIEMTANGKIDVYAKDSISFHTGADFNFHADRDINFQAGRNVNIKAMEDMQLETVKNFTVRATKDGNLTIGGKLGIAVTGNVDIRSGNTNIDGGNINLNSGSASVTPAKPLKTHTLPDIAKPIDSIMKRVPTFEPYPQHENLSPLDYTSAKTNRDADGRYDGVSSALKEPAKLWKTYTTATDTFAKVKAPEDQGTT
jgi:hypothetical protein